MDAEKLTPNEDSDIAIDFSTDAKFVLEKINCLLEEYVNLKISSKVSALKLENTKKYERIYKNNKLILKFLNILFNSIIFMHGM